MTLARPLSDTARLRALDSLPTLPIVAIRLGEVIHSKTASVPQVAEVLRSDPAISAKLLRLVNSPYFGIPGGVSDVARAVPFVGFNTLYELVLSISVLETLGARGGALDLRAMWTHALTVASAARELAQELRHADPGACFTAGLLHDMGKIALAKLEPDKLAAAYALMRREGISLAEAERRNDLPPHDRVGSQLARQWKFPATLATPIEQHHAIHRIEVRERMVPHLRAITEIVAAADHLSASCHTTLGAPGPADLCDEDGEPEARTLFERNGLGEAALAGLRDRTCAQLERSKIFLSLV